MGQQEATTGSPKHHRGIAFSGTCLHDGYINDSEDDGDGGDDGVVDVDSGDGDNGGDGDMVMAVMVVR